jgi:eukaryotic-like serine/threonine-protein kinase
MGTRLEEMLEIENVGGSVVAVAPAGAFAVGTVLKDTYRIVRPLAEGGCGAVYLAAHTRLPGAFAVKVLRASLTRDREALARFRQEAEITSTLRHPHIVQVFDFDATEGGVHYLVMELLEGVPLADLVRPGAPLDPRRAINIVEQIAQALHAAHERGVVHRDLKPDNVMLLSVGGADDFIKVLDFGISQASWRTRLTDNDRVSGTPQYMAPEQAQGLREQIDHRTDQFSLAAIAYTLFTGREPFSGDNPIAVLYQVVHNEPPAPAEANPALGVAISNVIERGLSKQSADRFADVLEFAAALRAAVDATTGLQPSGAPEVANPVEAAELIAAPPGRETRRLIRRIRRKNAAPRRILVLALAAGLAVFAWFHPTTRGPTRAAWEQLAGPVHKVIDSFRS